MPISIHLLIPNVSSSLHLLTLGTNGIIRRVMLCSAGDADLWSLRFSLRQGRVRHHDGDAAEVGGTGQRHGAGVETGGGEEDED